MLKLESSEEDTKVILYVITAMDTGEDEAIDSESDSWRGKIFYTHSLIKNKFAAVTEEVKEVQS